MTAPRRPHSRTSQHNPGRLSSSLPKSQRADSADETTPHQPCTALKRLQRFHPYTDTSHSGKAPTRRPWERTATPTSQPHTTKTSKRRPASTHHQATHTTTSANPQSRHKPKHVAIAPNQATGHTEPMEAPPVRLSRVSRGYSVRVFPYTGMVDSEAPTRGRPRTADGRRKLVSVRVSEPKFAAIEAARGGKPRSEWVEAAIDAYLSPRVSPVLLGSALNPQPVYGNPGRIESAEPVYGNDEPAVIPCKHPAEAVEAGECGICHADVW